MCIATNSGAPLVDREVLPSAIKPINYNVTLEPNFEDFTFEGEETITLKVAESTNTITLNTLEIEYLQVKINGEEIDSSTYEFDDEKQRVSFKATNDLKEGSEAYLYIKFKGILNDQMAGFYRSSYQEDGKTKYLATTQFEPIDCRRAFPSFDEPALKATFDISLIANKDLECLSNMDVKSTTSLDGDRKKVVFNTTPIMSTYLVAFIVGDLNYVECNDYRVPVRVYSTPGSEDLSHYSAEISAKTLKFFDEKFDIPYPLPKCDLVAIHDFAAGAMENYGLITFRTVEVLIDPKKASVNVLKRVTEVVMHELAHQWFGNLVTMDFWDGLWLNEGFATWMSWYACDALFPEWKVWESYVTDDLQQALALDGLRSSHPIEVPLKRANDVNQIFDSISYAKGSSLLKMISNWLGEETFITGVSNYLKKHKWGNTQTKDLWHALGDASGEDVNSVMDIWTKNTGYPLVTVKELSNKEIEVTQHRFLTTGDVTEEDDKIIYPVFLSLKSSKGVDSSLTLNLRTKTFKLDIGDDDFFKINANQAGIFRTAYDLSRWKKLGEAGVEGKLSVEDRAGLVADAKALSLSGYIPTSSLLSLIRSWTNEPSSVVWDEIIGSIAFLKSTFNFENEKIKLAITGFLYDLINPKFNEVGYLFKDTDSFDTQQLKIELFSAAISSENEQMINYCKEAFTKYAAGDENAVHSNVRTTVFKTAAKYGDISTYDALLKIYKTSKAQDVRISALYALGSFRDEKILDQVLELLFDFDVVKKQDTYKPLVSMSGFPLGINKQWEWYTKNFDKLLEYHPPELSIFSTLTKLAVRGFTKQEQKDKVIEFFKDKDTSYYGQSLNQALDSVTAKINYLEKEYDAVSKWLEAEGYQSKL